MEKTLFNQDLATASNLIETPADCIDIIPTQSHYNDEMPTIYLTTILNIKHKTIHVQIKLPTF